MFAAVMLADLHFAFRQLRKDPGFTAVAVLTIALGIGANTAVFTVVNAVLLKPLPWPDSHRVVSVWESNPARGLPQAPMAAAQFLDLRRDAKSFAALAVWSPVAVNLVSDGAPPERYQGAEVTEDFFRVVTTAPAQGPGFHAGQFDPGRDDVVMISDGIWRQRYAGDPKLIGTSIRVNGQRRTVVGIMPPGFQTPAKAQFWVPKIFGPQETRDRDYKAQPVLGRLADGVTLDQARTELEGLFSGLRSKFPDVLEGWSVRVHPALEDVVKTVRPALLLLLAAVVTVLLMAVVNVASLLLTRGVARAGELSVRAALGAGRGALVRQLFIESLLLAGLGGALGLLLAHWLLNALLAVAPVGLPRIDQVRIDSVVLFFTAGACVLAALLFGLAPAWQLSLADPVRSLGGGSARATTPVGRLRRGLVVFQIAAAAIVLVATGLLLRSFGQLMRRDLGFEPARLLTVRLELSPNKYANEGRRNVFAEEILRRLKETPGVEATAAATLLPLQGWPQWIMRLEENPSVRVSDAPSTGYAAVTPDYFRTMGMEVLVGRGIQDGDRAGHPLVCVVNEAFVRRHFGGRGPLRRRLEVGLSDPPRWMEIVGMVNNTPNAALETAAREQVFVPLDQQPDALAENPSLSLVVRTSPRATGVTEAIRAAVWKLDPDQPVHLLRPMTEMLGTVTAERRFTVTLLGVFAAVALVLATVGLYGVMSGQVAARTHEVGIRMALGAQRGEVLAMMVGQGSRTLGLGLAGGLMAAAGVARLLQSMLFETVALEPWVYAGVATLLAGVGLLACLLPARRAARVNPMVALRSEG